MTIDAVAPGVRAEIDRALDRIAGAAGVRILLAVESGSRAWGFPSPDSDYDVRFIYMRPQDDYLSIGTPRDVIEAPITAELDVNGWDLRKALQLAVRSNAVVLEWLGSPIRYRADAAAVALLTSCALDAAWLPALAYHYDRLARRSWQPAPDAPGPIRLKSYFYALRPALALAWMRTRAEPPPMNLQQLLAGTDLPGAVLPAVDALVARKAAAIEAEIVERDVVIDAWLTSVLCKPSAPPAPWDRHAGQIAADRVFRRLVLGEASPGQP